MSKQLNFSNQTRGNVSKSYSENYYSIRKTAESKWPAWKVDAYNTGIAVSAHAKKVISK